MAQTNTYEYIFLFINHLYAPCHVCCVFRSLNLFSFPPYGFRCAHRDRTVNSIFRNVTLAIGDGVCNAENVALKRIASYSEALLSAECQAGLMK